MLDIVRYLGRIFACRVNIVAATPKFPVPVFELQLGKAFVQLQAAFSLQEAHHAGHGILGRDFQPSLSVKHLPPEFWGEHYVVFAVPARMSHCSYIFHHRQKASWNHLPSWWFSVYTKKQIFPIKEKFAAMPYVSRAYERFRDPNDT